MQMTTGIFCCFNNFSQRINVANGIPMRESLQIGIFPSNDGIKNVVS